MASDSSESTILPDEDGNYDSPALQSLYGVWEDYDNETAGEEEVLLVVSRVEDFIRRQIQAMEKDAEAATVDVHDPNRVAILNGFQEHLSGLDKMREAFRSDDFELVDDAFEQIQAATNQMVMGYQGLLDDEAQFSPVLCVKCSHENKRTDSYCAKCGAILPKVEQEQEKRLIAVEDAVNGEETVAETTPNYIEVAEAYEAWKNETASSEQFHQVLLSVRERHLAQYDEIADTLSQTEVSNEVSELMEHLRTYAETLEQNVRAIDIMLESLENDDEEELEAGLNELAEATIQIIEAERRGEAITTPEEEVGTQP